MWTRPPAEVSCVSSSVESFYRGLVAGGVFGVVFVAPEVPALSKIFAPVRPAILAGSWCFFTSLASCVLTRGGLPFPFNGAISGLFSGAVIGLGCRWPRESVAWTMGSSACLSVISHYAMEGQQKESIADESGRPRSLCNSGSSTSS
mmetsp:Transcript_159147/g.281010  ORF Transcript_159147/g.281010 Transcript_159147/m.281010 type:complete len:147 (-) Transcript_159147:102-542(-)